METIIYTMIQGVSKKKKKMDPPLSMSFNF